MDGGPLTDIGFLRAVLLSPSFYRSVLPFLLLALCLAMLGWWLISRRRQQRRLAELHDDQAGVAIAVDAVLTLPIFLSLIMLAIQFMILANAALIVHYAAYSAARSGRVWVHDLYWDYRNDPGYRGADLNRYVRPHTSAYRQADRAARLALVAASTTNPRVPVRRLVPFPESLFRAMALASGYPERQAVFVRKARYAFDRDNVKLSLQVDDPIQVDRLKSEDSRKLPRRVGARVTFQVYLNVPFGWVIGTDRGDGIHTRAITAEMVVL